MATETLIFIDTSSLLELYKTHSGVEGLSVVTRLPEALGKMITTTQVEMEFLKNRERLINEALSSVVGSVPLLPAVLDEDSLARRLERKSAFDAAKKAVCDRLLREAKSPTEKDRLYPILQALYRRVAPYHLSRSHDDWATTYAAALERFMLGYPPRKAKDSAIGDALNWEWILRCAAHAHANVFIVSRDSDFGTSGVLTQFLREEFTERVGSDVTITLTDRITVGLKGVGVNVTEREIQEEDAIVRDRAAASIAVPNRMNGFADVYVSDDGEYFIDPPMQAIRAWQDADYQKRVSELIRPARDVALEQMRELMQATDAGMLREMRAMVLPAHDAALKQMQEMVRGSDVEMLKTLREMSQPAYNEAVEQFRQMTMPAEIDALKQLREMTRPAHLQALEQLRELTQPEHLKALKELYELTRPVHMEELKHLRELAERRDDPEDKSET